MDRNGYNPSILQEEMGHCFFWPSPTCECWKLDRHEVFGGSNRAKSKALGLWVLLCHNTCHEGPFGVHQCSVRREYLRAYAQRKAMDRYGWTTDDFIREFGKNYL